MGNPTADELAARYRLDDPNIYVWLIQADRWIPLSLGDSVRAIGRVFVFWSLALVVPFLIFWLIGIVIGHLIAFLLAGGLLIHAVITWNAARGPANRGDGAANARRVTFLGWSALLLIAVMELAVASPALGADESFSGNHTAFGWAIFFWETLLNTLLLELPESLFRRFSDITPQSTTGALLLVAFKFAAVGLSVFVIVAEVKRNFLFKFSERAMTWAATVPGMIDFLDGHRHLSPDIMIVRRVANLGDGSIRGGYSPVREEYVSKSRLFQALNIESWQSRPQGERFTPFPLIQERPGA